MPSDKHKGHQSTLRKNSGKGTKARFRAEDNKERRIRKQAKMRERKIEKFVKRLVSGKPVPNSPLGRIARGRSD